MPGIRLSKASRIFLTKKVVEKALVLVLEVSTTATSQKKMYKFELANSDHS